MSLLLGLAKHHKHGPAELSDLYNSGGSGAPQGIENLKIRFQKVHLTSVDKTLAC